MINALKQIQDLLNAEIERPENAEKKILVPDNIGIEEYQMRLELWFGENRSLGYTFDDGWRGSYRNKRNRVKCKLVKCTREDLNPSDLFFRTDIAPPDFSSIFNYAIWLGDGTYIYPNNENGVSESKDEWKYYYKVSKI